MHVHVFIGSAYARIIIITRESCKRESEIFIEGSKMGLALSQLSLPRLSLPRLSLPRLIFMKTPFSGKLELDAAVWNTYADYYGKLLYYFSTNRERRESCVVFRPKVAEDADVRCTFMGIVTVDGFTGFWGASCKLTEWNPPQDGQKVEESVHPWNLFSLVLCFFDYAEDYDKYGGYNLITNNSNHFQRGLVAKMEMEGANYYEKSQELMKGFKLKPGNYNPIHVLNTTLGERGHSILLKM